MTKAFKCADIGFDCGYETTAESDQEMMEKLARHAQDVHDMATIPPEVVEKVQGAIREI
ncbi:MAG: DUF1059 domain-containing protein [Thermoplasmata archaeon]